MVIDKSKGIVAKSMPRTWHDRHAANTIEDEETRSLYRSIVADKKPYFMRYIYPALMRQYKTYIDNTNKNALREFSMTVQELYDTDPSGLSAEQSDFLAYYEFRMPVGTGDCVMNKICKRFEEIFDGVIKKQRTDNFDYSMMKSGAVYTQRQFDIIKSLASDYNKRVKSYASFAERDRVDASEYAVSISAMQDDFRAACIKACPDRFALCDIILDLCYTKATTKRFAWNMCGEEIIHNLLVKNEWKISWPEASEEGDIIYCGNKYILREMKLGDEVDEC